MIYTVEFAALVRTRSKIKPSTQYATQASSINQAHPLPRNVITAKIDGRGGGNGRKQGQCEGTGAMEGGKDICKKKSKGAEWWQGQ